MNKALTPIVRSKTFLEGSEQRIEEKMRNLKHLFNKYKQYSSKQNKVKNLKIKLQTYKEDDERN